MSKLIASLPQILEHMPHSWRGTTFNNLNLLGRGGFASRLRSLINSGAPITADALSSVGESEDYLRVASNVSTLLEMVLAEKMGVESENVFSFASLHFQILAVCFVSGGKPVRLYLGNYKSPFSGEQLTLLSKLRCFLEVHPGLPQKRDDEIVLAYVSEGLNRELVDGLVDNHALYVLNAAAIPPAEILVRRKRMATPITTPAAENVLRELAGVARHHAPHTDPTKFLAHLQTMSGAVEDASLSPLCFTAGLPAIATLWSALVTLGGAEVLMASTAYGGSSQLTDLMVTQAGLRKHTFDVMGDISMEKSIEECFGRLSKQDLKPTVVLFVETPTNPDMKVPDMSVLAKTLNGFCKATNRRGLFLVDTTFAPASHVISKMHQIDPDLSCVVFLSMSKSVSRGHTVAGALVFNNQARDLHKQAHLVCSLFDTSARPDQMRVLSDNHVGVEERCAKAYAVAAAVGAHLVDVVRPFGELHFAFVSEKTASQGFSSSTFSFNLPPLPAGSAADNEALAQRFVDLLVLDRPDLFKPCVSFGQDNGLVYCTVPATSTQGAIKAEDKAKQALGGVQLTRLSFPPTIDVDAVKQAIDRTIHAIYK